MSHLLIVDDNDRYARLLTELFGPLGYQIDRATTARDGLAALRNPAAPRYDVLVTDITMETKLAGFNLLKALKPQDYPPVRMVASTALNEFPVIDFHRMLYRGLGVHAILPKKELRQGQPIYYTLKLGAKAKDTFNKLAPDTLAEKYYLASSSGGG